MTRSIFVKAQRAYEVFVRTAEKLQSPLLFVMRLYWGGQFFLAGKGKLMNLGQAAEFFGSLGLPFPMLNAVLASTTECVGGLLLIVGFGSRLVCIPLAVTMAVAYVTAERDSLTAIISDTDKVLGAAPFLFLLTTLIVLAFGPGVFSLDWLLRRKLQTVKSAEVK